MQHKDELLVIETLKSMFEDEISNNMVFKKKEIIITLLDGTKAKVRTETVA